MEPTRNRLAPPRTLAARRLPTVSVVEVREATGLSVREFARRYGFSEVSVQSWESGASTPYPAARILLAVLAVNRAAVDAVLPPEPPSLPFAANHDPTRRKVSKRRN